MKPALVLSLVGIVVAAQSPAAVRVPILDGRNSFKLLVDVDGTVKVWGNAESSSPNFGDGVKIGGTQRITLTEPRPIAGVSDVVDAAVSGTHVLLLERDGTVLAWGRNDSCQLGNGTDKDVYSPSPVPGLHDIKQVVAMGRVSGAVAADGSVWMWGDARDGALGNGLSGWRTPCTKVPTRVNGIDRVVQLATDGETVLARRDDGTVWGWGKNSAGSLCDGSSDPRTAPVQAKGIAGAAFIAVAFNSAIVLADGTVRMCGKDAQGELGDTAHAEHLTPFKVPGLTTVKTARIDGGTTIVQLSDGTLRAWGNGYYGALGDGTGDRTSAKPVAPIGLGPVLAHYFVDGGSYAIKADGTVMVWCVPAPKGEKTEFILKPRAMFSLKVAPD